jgi:hypothetical protein
MTPQIPPRPIGLQIILFVICFLPWVVGIVTTFRFLVHLPERLPALWRRAKEIGTPIITRE